MEEALNELGKADLETCLSHLYCWQEKANPKLKFQLPKIAVAFARSDFNKLVDTFTQILFDEKKEGFMRKRGWGAITVDILEATLTPQKKTRIMYKANLNYERFDEYFYDLLGKGFIVGVDDNDGKYSYMISEQGRIFLVFDIFRFRKYG